MGAPVRGDALIAGTFVKNQGEFTSDNSVRGDRIGIDILAVNGDEVRSVTSDQIAGSWEWRTLDSLKFAG